MKTGWSIGTHRVEVEIGAPRRDKRALRPEHEVEAEAARVLVDEVLQRDVVLEPKRVGEWPLEAAGREVRLRRVRNVNGVRSELWVSGVRVPPSIEPIPRKKAPSDARCQPHPAPTAQGHSDPAAAPLAKIACGVCSAPICADCVAVDGVRCKGCFKRAAKALRVEERAARMTGPILALTIAFMVALFGVLNQSPRMTGTGLSAVVLVGYMMFSMRSRERLEARAREEAERRPPR